MKINAYNPSYNLALSDGTAVAATTISYTHTSLGSNTPLVESGAGSPGSGPQASAWDHVHPEFGGGGGSSSFGSNSNSVGTANAAGASASNSRADHVHQGVHSLAKSGSSALVGDVTLTGGTNVTLTQSGQDISIAASGGGSSGGFVLLETQTASSSATLNFTATISSTYNTYLIVVEGIQPATNTRQLLMRVSTNGGSSYDTGNNYAYARSYRFPPNGSGIEGANPDSALAPVGGSHDNSHEGIQGLIWFYNPLDTQYRELLFDLTRWVASGINVPVSDRGMGQYTSTTAVNAFQFLFDSGNIASGVIRSYGLTK